jgi:cardiolipin synthase
VIDDSLATVGTTNMDYRSFNINFEVNAFVYSDEIAQELKTQFYDDLKFSTELTLNRWEKRPLTKKVIESFARLFAPLL